MANECVVYHKHLAGMDLTDGYIGISKNFEDRMKQHHRDAFVRNSIYTVHERMRMHGNEVITSKIFEGTIDECFDYEEELRPRWHMGWNMAIGGGRPGSGWKPNRKWLDNRVWHNEHGEVMIHKGFIGTDFAKKYMPEHKSTSTVSGNLSAILYGKIPNCYGWELANAQLVSKVKERNRKVWEQIYLIKNNEVVSVNKKGVKHFAKHIGVKPSGFGIKHVVNGTQSSLHGWELATEEEWLETAERVEFK